MKIKSVSNPVEFSYSCEDIAMETFSLKWHCCIIIVVD